MKKVLLTSAAVLAVFASSAAVFADGELGANRWSNESGIYVEDNNQPATVDSIKILAINQKNGLAMLTNLNQVKTLKLKKVKQKLLKLMKIKMQLQLKMKLKL